MKFYYFKYSLIIYLMNLLIYFEIILNIIVEYFFYKEKKYEKFCYLLKILKNESINNNL